MTDFSILLFSIPWGACIWYKIQLTNEQRKFCLLACYHNSCPKNAFQSICSISARLLALGRHHRKGLLWPPHLQEWGVHREERCIVLLTSRQAPNSKVGQTLLDVLRNLEMDSSIPLFQHCCGWLHLWWQTFCCSAYHTVSKFHMCEQDQKSQGLSN